MYDNALERKYAFNDLTQLDNEFSAFFAEVNSPEFVAQLGRVAGLDRLVPDNALQGGGLHQIVRGGKLDVHEDFNVHHELKAFRKLNLIVYLNEGWDAWSKLPNKMDTFVVYCHTCLVTGKSYIGWTSKTLDERWKKHVTNARSKSQYRFHRAIRKYGIETWRHITLASVISEQEAKRLEQRWIKRCRTFDPAFGYNSSYGGESCVPTLETREKLSVSQRLRYQDPEERRKVGQRTVPTSDVTREKLRQSKLGSKNPQFGKVSNRRRPVDCFTLDGTYVTSYPSIRVAARANGFCEGHIGATCRGARRHHMNFVWRFST